MENFVFSNETKIVFGRGTEALVGVETAAWGKKVLLHYGGGHIVRTGLKAVVEKSLQEAGVEYIELGGVQPNPRLSLVREGIDLIRKHNIESILAVGGGSVIDSAKAMALGALYDGDVWDFYIGKAEPKKAMPVGVVLTIPAAGSEASPSSVITNEDGWLKRSVDNVILRPRFAIMNPELTFTLPPYQTACGVADMMAHIMERYFTNTREVDLTDQLCEAALRSIIKYAPRALEEPENYDVRANIMWAGTIAHNDLLGTGRVGDWASHTIEHEISGIYDLAHGAGLSIVFPAWMKYVYKHDIQRFVQFAARVWGVDPDYHNPERTVFEGIRRLEEFFKRMGLPVRLSDADIPGDRIEEMAAKCTDNGTRTVGRFVELGQEDVLNIYKLSL